MRDGVAVSRESEKLGFQQSHKIGKLDMVIFTLSHESTKNVQINTRKDIKLLLSSPLGGLSPPLRVYAEDFVSLPSKINFASVFAHSLEFILRLREQNSGFTFHYHFLAD